VLKKMQKEAKGERDAVSSAPDRRLNRRVRNAWEGKLSSAKEKISPPTLPGSVHRRNLNASSCREANIRPIESSGGLLITQKRRLEASWWGAHYQSKEPVHLAGESPSVKEGRT